jgi:hypothetical protein
MALHAQAAKRHIAATAYERCRDRIAMPRPITGTGHPRHIATNVGFVRSLTQMDFTRFGRLHRY